MSGSFSDPNGIAVDESSGNVYVADMGADEQQTVSIDGGSTSGGFTLEFEGEKTAAVTLIQGGTPGEVFAPSAEAIEFALDTLPKIELGNVAVYEEGSLPGTVTYTITFQGVLAITNVPSLVCDGTGLSGTSPACVAATTRQGIEGSIYKFDSEGNPVDFPARASNRLTGAATPAHSFAFPITAKDTPATIA